MAAAGWWLRQLQHVKQDAYLPPVSSTCQQICDLSTWPMGQVPCVKAIKCATNAITSPAPLRPLYSPHAIWTLQVSLSFSLARAELLFTLRCSLSYSLQTFCFGLMSLVQASLCLLLSTANRINIFKIMTN